MMPNTKLLLNLALAGVLALLAACAAPSAQSPDRPAPADAAVPMEPAPVAPAPPAAPPARGRVDRPEPVRKALPPQRKGGEVDLSCKTDADCAVKNVGSCCGYFPACVNKDSPTDPEGVKAECSAQGMSSICGFREVSACSCVQGQCRDAGGPGGAVTQ